MHKSSTLGLMKNNINKSNKLSLYFSFLYSLLLLTFNQPVISGYKAVGPIKADDCYDFGIKYCRKRTVTEVVVDGKRFHVQTDYPSVSEYRNNTCWINIKSRGLGVFSWGINAATNPVFYGYDEDGKRVKVDAEYLYFKCIKY